VWDNSLRIISSIGIGFSIFILLVFIIWYFFSYYNILGVIILLVCVVVISAQHLWKPVSSFKKTLKSYDVGKPLWKTRLMIDEMLFIAITFLLSVNVVSVFRPFPIGWDDLWVYMNLPKLLSTAWEIIPLGHMHFWQIYTGIWFLAWSQTFAFFLNSFSGFVLALIAYLSIKSLTSISEKSYDFWLLGVLILLMMPMSIFQLAKDMKLDIWLLAISIIPFTIVIKALFFWKKSNKDINILLLIAWFLIWIAFSIKMTSLLLLLGVLKLLFFKKYGFSGVLIFFLLFVGIFTLGGFWSLMNIRTPDISQSSLFLFSAVCILAWVILTGYEFARSKAWTRLLVRLGQETWIILMGFVLALMPWWIKNISELPKGASLWIHQILGGANMSYKADYKSLYTESEYEEIITATNLISSKWTTQDEDLWRYFWYETGINNYLKLPWNLTFQTNQKGEFTDITFIFFALIPLIFIILPYKREVYRWPVLWVTLLLLSYYIPSPIASLWITLFSNIQIPFWYFFIVILSIIPLVYFYLTLDKTNKYAKLFLVNYVFSVIYVLLWSISAFGIVWYGILMYFVFILMIWFSLMSLEEENESHFFYMSYIVLGVVALYVLMSSIPHAITNLRNAGYQDYKLWGMSEEVALIDFHPEYFNILFELNISDDKKNDFFISHRNTLLSIIDNTVYSEGLIPQIQWVTNLRELNNIIKQLIRFDLQNQQAETAIESLQQSLYYDVMYSAEADKNKKYIYRVGTFLKYYISENNTRLLDDSLLMSFDNYIHDEDDSVTKQRFEKLGMGYILLDINAATIDRDPERRLTQRYENMLWFVANSQLELIDTDSVCLRIALDGYKVDQDISKYIDIAGVNYSYKKSTTEKKTMCIQKITSILSNAYEFEKYPYLSSVLRLLERADISLEDTETVEKALLKFIPNGHKVLFKIK
jgi:hypothetical protein